MSYVSSFTGKEIDEILQKATDLNFTVDFSVEGNEYAGGVKNRPCYKTFQDKQGCIFKSWKENSANKYHTFLTKISPKPDYSYVFKFGLYSCAYGNTDDWREGEKPFTPYKEGELFNSENCYCSYTFNMDGKEKIILRRIYEEPNDWGLNYSNYVKRTSYFSITWEPNKYYYFNEENHDYEIIMEQPTDNNWYINAYQNILEDIERVAKFEVASSEYGDGLVASIDDDYIYLEIIPNYRYSYSNTDTKPTLIEYDGTSINFTLRAFEEYFNFDWSLEIIGLNNQAVTYHTLPQEYSNTKSELLYCSSDNSYFNISRNGKVIQLTTGFYFYNQAEKRFVFGDKVRGIRFGEGYILAPGETLKPYIILITIEIFGHTDTLAVPAGIIEEQRMSSFYDSSKFPGIISAHSSEYITLLNAVGKIYTLNFESEQLATQAEKYLKENFMLYASDYYIEHTQTNCDMIQLAIGGEL